MTTVTDVYHSGLPYRDIEEFVDAALPYLRSGIHGGEAVIAVTSKRNLAALQSRLGSAAHHIDFFDHEQWYDSPARSLHRYLEYWNQRNHTGWMPLRILGEPMKPAHDSRDAQRWTAFENGINDLMKSMPVRMMCPYDLTMPINSRANVEIAHPHIAYGSHVQPSGAFVPPQQFGALRNSMALAQPRGDVCEVAFDGDTMPALRAALAAFAAREALQRANRIDLYVAVGEAAANAVMHGGGGGVLRLWRDEREVVADVVSRAGGFNGTMGGYLPPPPFAESGRGLWVMRQLCEWVEIRSDADASTVRLHLRVKPRLRALT